MRRLDWQLVRPPRADEAEEVEQLERRVDALVARATETLIDERDLEQLITLERSLEERTVSACEAVEAPRVEDDPDWEARAVDEYGESESELELEEFLELRRVEPDCDRCPYASPYSLYPMDPCELTAGPLLYLVEEPAIHAQIIEPLAPEQMLQLADTLDSLIAEGRWLPHPALDEVDYLEKASFFLRFWSGHGFSIRPVFLDDEVPVLTPEGPQGGPGESNDPSPMIH